MTRVRKLESRAGNQEQIGEELFYRRLPQIEKAIHGIAVRHRLSSDERNELYSQVMLKIVHNDFAVLRGFEGRSSWVSYLRVVARRVLLDERVHRWGRWRPSALSRRLGPLAIELDRRINRDGLEPMEAVRVLELRGAAPLEQLEELAAAIPRPCPRRFVSADVPLGTLAEDTGSDWRIEVERHRRISATVKRVLGAVMDELPKQERSWLGLRFGRGWTVRRIAASQNLEARPLYRSFERILRRLRRRLEEHGLSWGDVGGVLEGQGEDLEIEW